MSVTRSSTVNWTPDYESSSCEICSKKFGLVKNRRHHCRRCGRICCYDCSPYFVVLDNNNLNAETQRVCVDCNKNLIRIKREHEERKYKLEQEIAFLQSTSYMSDNLVRVYFLDSSFKTLAVNDETTSLDLTEKLCTSNVKCALFEVEENINNPWEFSIVKTDELITNVFARWKNSNKPHAKLVLPMYDKISVMRRGSISSSSNSNNNSSNTSSNPSKIAEDMGGERGAAFELNRRQSLQLSRNAVENLSRSTNDGGSGEIDGERATEISQVAKLQLRLDAKEDELEKLQKKFESLKMTTARLKREKALSVGKHILQDSEEGGSGAFDPRHTFDLRTTFDVRSSMSMSSIPMHWPPEVHKRVSNIVSTGTGTEDYDEDGDNNRVDTEVDVNINNIDIDVHTDIRTDVPIDEDESIDKGEGIIKDDKAVESNINDDEEGSVDMFSGDASIGERSASVSTCRSDSMNLSRNSIEIGSVLRSSVQMSRGEDLVLGGQTASIEEVETKKDRASISSHFDDTNELLKSGSSDDNDDDNAVYPKENEGQVDDEFYDDEENTKNTGIQQMDDAKTRLESCLAYGQVWYKRNPMDPRWNYRFFVLNPGHFIATQGTIPEEERNLPRSRSSSGKPKYYHYPTLAIYQSPQSAWPYSVLSFNEVTNIVTNGKKVIIRHEQEMDKLRKIRRILIKPDPVTNEKRDYWKNFLTVALEMAQKQTTTIGTAYRVHSTHNRNVTSKAIEANTSEEEDRTNADQNYDNNGDNNNHNDEDSTASSESEGIVSNASLYTGIPSPADVLVMPTEVQSIMFAQFAKDSITFYSALHESMWRMLANLTSVKPQEVTDLYNIVSTMQSIYDVVTHMGEDWALEIRAWLLDLLMEHMTIPVHNPELLEIVIQCLAKDGTLFSSQSVDIFNQIIKQSFDQTMQTMGSKSVEELTTENVLLTVRAMTRTLDTVVEELVPKLPPTLNLLTMWKEVGEERIRTNIISFYENNKESLGNHEMMELLSFADAQETVMKEYGVDAKVISKLAADMLQQYKNVTTTAMHQWMERIFENEKLESKKFKSLSDVEMSREMRCTWPEDLMTCCCQQTRLAINNLRSESKVVICRMVVENIPKFLRQLISHYEEEVGRFVANRGTEKGNIFGVWKTKRRAESVTKEDFESLRDVQCLQLCALQNNLLRFSNLIDEEWQWMQSEDSFVKIHSALDTLEDLVRKLQSLIERKCAWTKEVLYSNIAQDFEHIVCNDENKLFGSNWYSTRLLPQELRATMADYNGDLKMWIYGTDVLQEIVVGVLRKIVLAYLKKLLTEGHSVTSIHLVALLSRDVADLRSMWLDLITNDSEGEGDVASMISKKGDQVNLVLKPLEACISLLTAISPDNAGSQARVVASNAFSDTMSEVVASQIIPCFGQHATSVWFTLMYIREDRDVTINSLYRNLQNSFAAVENLGKGTHYGESYIDISDFASSLKGGRTKRTPKIRNDKGDSPKRMIAK